MTKKDEKSLIIKENSGELALGRTKNILDITNRILANAPAKIEEKTEPASEPAPPEAKKKKGFMSLFRRDKTGEEVATRPQHNNEMELSGETGPFGKSFRDETTGMEFVWIPGGTFQMGDVLGDHKEVYWMECSLPVHTVTLEGFYLGKYAVTQGEWQKVMKDNPSRFPKGNRYPVEEVSWDDVQDFIKRLNSASGKGYILPSEAQWEYAAREGGKKVRFGTGHDTISSKEANFDASEEYVEPYSRAGESRREAVPVDSFSPNALGLYQMSGNVDEWCQDVWHDNYKGAPTDGSAWEQGEEGSYRVVHGGGWIDSPVRLRAAYRLRCGAGARGYAQGFRLSLPVHRRLS